MLKQHKNFELTYVAVDMAQFATVHVNAASLAMPSYFRLRIASLLPQLNKVLYLDSDIVVHGNIAPLWEIDLGQHWLGAVHEPLFWPSYFATLGITNGLYFNSGVLLLNLAQMRVQNCEAKFFAVVAEKPTQLVSDDQCVLNQVCHGHVLWLPPQFNVTPAYTKKHTKANFVCSPYTAAQRVQACQNPVVLHFVGAKKPWHYVCRHPNAHTYMHYIKLTPWADYVHPDRTWLNRLQKWGFVLKTNIKFFIKNVKKCKN